MWSIYAVAGLVLLAVALYKLWPRSSGSHPERLGLELSHSDDEE